MISFLLKNRGLRLQLLVGLLLVLGSFPEPSEGLKCYQCDDTGRFLSNKCNKPKAVPCPSSEYCGKSVTTTARGDKITLKSCVEAANAKCFKRTFHSECVSAKGLKQSKQLFKLLRICEQARSQRSEEGDKLEFIECLCKSNLCNTGSSGGHSTSVILFAILTPRILQLDLGLF